MAIDESGNVTFTAEEQAKVDSIVQERLARAKAEKPADYDDLQEIAKELEAFDFTGTPAEKKAAIKAARAELTAQKELEELQKQAKTEGTSPELLKEIKELKKEIGELKGERQAQKQAEESRKQADEKVNEQIAAMQEKHSDVDLKALLEDQKFVKFAKGKNLPLVELYEDFVEFVGETEAATIAKVKSKEERSTGSGKNSGSPGGNYGLTDNQKN
jgi:hypothetical protein